MASRLTNKTKAGTIVATNVRFASTFLERAIGLMGKKPLPIGDALFFKGTHLLPCNSIQTTFMRFPLDVLFLDLEMKVKSIQRDVKPWRITWPVNGAVTAIEMTAGSLASANIEIGDQLHVGD
jgi:uncharacterized membrane protein (UPF0127 family)